MLQVKMVNVAGILQKILPERKFGIRCKGGAILAFSVHLHAQLLGVVLNLEYHCIRI
jgi:hypothetical protein